MCPCGPFAAILTLAALPVQVGPFANPNEVYSFYNLPFCAPTDLEIRREDLGPLLKGDRPYKTLYDIKFRESHSWKSLCKTHLSEAQVKQFRQAIVDDYYFEMMLGARTCPYGGAMTHDSKLVCLVRASAALGVALLEWMPTRALRLTRSRPTQTSCLSGATLASLRPGMGMLRRAATRRATTSSRTSTFRWLTMDRGS